MSARHPVQMWSPEHLNNFILNYLFQRKWKFSAWTFSRHVQPYAKFQPIQRHTIPTDDRSCSVRQSGRHEDRSPDKQLVQHQQQRQLYSCRLVLVWRGICFMFLKTMPFILSMLHFSSVLPPPPPLSFYLLVHLNGRALDWDFEGQGFESHQMQHTFWPLVIYTRYCTMSG